MRRARLAADIYVCWGSGGAVGAQRPAADFICWGKEWWAVAHAGPAAELVMPPAARHLLQATERYESDQGPTGAV